MAGAPSLLLSGSATAGVGDPIPAGASGPGITGDASGDGGGPVLARHAAGAGDLPIPPFNLAHPFSEGNSYNK